MRRPALIATSRGLFRAPVNALLGLTAALEQDVLSARLWGSITQVDRADPPILGCHRGSLRQGRLEESLRSTHFVEESV